MLWSTDMNHEEAHKNDKKGFLQILADDRNGWIICVVSILINIVRSGITFTFGLYIAEFRRLYQSPMAELSKHFQTRFFLKNKLKINNNNNNNI